MPEALQKELKKLFKKHKILDLRRLRKLLHGRSPRSVFRDLKEAHGISSYSHAGRYYTLKQIPCFNEHGLWLFEDVGFSEYGTLAATIEHWVSHSAAGYTYPELKEFFTIPVGDALLDLTEKRLIQRDREARGYVYYSIERERAEQQRRQRQTQQRQQVAISEPIVIEVLAEVIRHSKVCVELRELQERLERRGIVITLRQIAEILELYHVKKTLASK